MIYFRLFGVTFVALLTSTCSGGEEYGGPCCPAGWTLYTADSNATQPKCALAVKDWSTNFVQSEEACAALGGRMVSIHSPAQNKIIHDLTKLMPYSKPYYMWIGLSKSAKADNRWYWSDGSDIDYSNWLKGFPGNDNDSCAIMYTKPGQFESKDGEWRDVDCDRLTAPYVCEKLACVCGRTC